ncbi:MAG: transposase [Saprospiraceae bacterium]
MQLHLFEPGPYENVLSLNFKDSDLGRLHSTIPFRELAEAFKPAFRSCPQGAKAIFSLEGGLGLMFLKHLTQLSDAKLISRINTDWHLQMFCGLAPKVHYGIKDKDIVGRWRRFFGLRLNISELQDRLVSAWGADLEHTQASFQDATVYESYIKFPTDVKLLWDCVEWVQGQIESICDCHRLRRPRSKYKAQKIKQIAFSKKRKKSRKEDRRRRSALIYLLAKLLKQLQSLLNLGAKVIEDLKPAIFERIRTIRRVLQQQRYHFSQPEKSVPDRIVSLYKPYLHPIVRGKENKPVEFGAKVHQLQIGGCNFIEHLSFSAFHEGNRLKKAIGQQRRWFGTVRQVGADGIYANNRNRTWCREQGIATSFKPKGRQGKHLEQKKVMRNSLSNIRSTVLEGSFGNEKNHYMLRKVKARTQETEIAWIFFGVHTANAVKIAKARVAKAALQKLEAKAA